MGRCARARRGQLAEFTGVSSPYEAPLAADLTLDLWRLALQEEVAQFVGRIGHHDPAAAGVAPDPRAGDTGRRVKRGARTAERLSRRSRTGERGSRRRNGLR
ncbi:adenylyl-sulfate kinase [Accumulibacter sp.]|uniref:adenylyl-sulfate kinase n=1 Tax=Accumulibacter sp. TaxID=2053492 RepID=UPI003442AE13